MPPAGLWSSLLPEAVRRVIIHHADRLHEGIADGRADELEAALEEILAQRVRLRGFCRHCPAGVDARRAADEAPHISVEAAELLLHGEKGPGIGNGRVDLQAVAHDAFV